MKKIGIVFIVFLLCGCSTKYQLNIDGDKISEKINFSLQKSQFQEISEDAPDTSIHSKDTLNYLNLYDIYAIKGSQRYVYEKQVFEDGDVLTYDLSYHYLNGQFKDSRLINECFENQDIVMDKNKISIHLSGKFKCLESTSDNFEFKIVTNNKVESANITYGILDKEYVWDINAENKNNVDIQIEMLAESKYKYYGVRIFIIALIVTVLFGGLFLYYKISNRENINKI